MLTRVGWVSMVLGFGFGVGGARAADDEFERFARRDALIKRADLILLGEVTHVRRRESAKKLLRKKEPQAWTVTILPSVVLKGEVADALVLPIRVDGAGRYLDACGDDRPVHEGDSGAWHFLRDEDGLHLEAFVHVERTRSFLGKTSRHKAPTRAQALACEQATVERHLCALACAAARRALALAPAGLAEERYAQARAALEAYRVAELAFVRAYAPRREPEDDYVREALRDPRRRLEREARRKGLAPAAGD